MQERYSPKTLAYRLKSISWMLFTICITGAICVAQIDRAAFTGTVTDATGAVIQHAEVQAVDLATGLKSEAQTNSRSMEPAPAARSILKPRAEPTNITAAFLSISATTCWTRARSLILIPSEIRYGHLSG